MAVPAIGADINQLSEFRDVFGMRYVGPVDSGSAVYTTHHVPNPTAPYPQDYIIDQQGVVRYWSDQFDPKEVIATIDRLLATGVGECSTLHASRIMPDVGQNPAKGPVRLGAGTHSRASDKAVVSLCLACSGYGAKRVTSSGFATKARMSSSIAARVSGLRFPTGR